MPEDKDFEQNETKAEEQLQIVDPPESDGEGSGQQEAGNGAPTGGAEDPGSEGQNPSDVDDDQQNEPLPRTWN